MTFDPLELFKDDRKRTFIKFIFTLNYFSILLKNSTKEENEITFNKLAEYVKPGNTSALAIMCFLFDERCGRQKYRTDSLNIVCDDAACFELQINVDFKSTKESMVAIKLINYTLDNLQEYKKMGNWYSSMLFEKDLSECSYVHSKEDDNDDDYNYAGELINTHNYFEYTWKIKDKILFSGYLYFDSWAEGRRNVPEINLPFDSWF